jgi:hypothetical protein
VEKMIALIIPQVLVLVFGRLNLHKNTRQPTSLARISVPFNLNCKIRIRFMSLMFTDIASIPSNCRFEIDDAEDEWLYPQKFDYIHGRFMAVCFKDPLAVFRRAFEACKPGGYFEMMDAVIPLRCFDDSLQGTYLEKSTNIMMEGAKLLGRDLTHVVKYKSYMETVGFVDVVETHFQWPINTWPKGKYHKTLGAWYNKDVTSGLAGMLAAVCTRGLGMTLEEVNEFADNVTRDMNNTSIHAYQAM